MKQVTIQEIENTVKDLANKDSFPLGKPNIKFIKNTEEGVLFEVTQMYDKPFEVNFKSLKAFSVLFDTDNLDIYYDISESGCDTCDYGSSYGYAIRVWK